MPLMVLSSGLLIYWILKIPSDPIVATSIVTGILTVFVAGLAFSEAIKGSERAQEENVQKPLIVSLLCQFLFC